MALKTASLTFSEVGLVVSPSRVLRRIPLAVPVITLITGLPLEKITIFIILSHYKGGLVKN
jgi:hypothetical protein